MLVTNNTPNVEAPFGRVCMLMQTSLNRRTDVSSLVCGMQSHWSIILHALHTTVILGLHMRMFMINNQIQLFYTSNKITPWRLWYRFGSHGPYALCGYNISTISTKNTKTTFQTGRQQSSKQPIVPFQNIHIINDCWL